MNSHPRWSIVLFDTNGHLKVPESVLAYDNFKISLRDGGEEDCHLVSIENKEDGHIPATEAGLRFLSEVAWFYDQPVLMIDYLGSAHPFNFSAKSALRRDGRNIDLNDFEQASTNREQRIAMGFYREALMSNSKFYAFLSFFKVLNISLKGPQQIAWINQELGSVRGSKHIVQSLAASGVSDIGDHLYTSGRCALAHALVDPVVDMDNVADLTRIRDELDLVRELSDIFIAKKLGLRSRTELRLARQTRAFAAMIDPSLLTAVVQGDQVAPERFKSTPRLDIRIQGKEQLDALRGLQFKVVEAGEGVLVLSGATSINGVVARFTIDFRTDQIFLRNDSFGLEKTATRLHQRDYYRFLMDFLSNGRVEFISGDGEVVSRLDPFLPTDIDFRATEQEISRRLADLDRDDGS